MNCQRSAIKSNGKLSHNLLTYANNKLGMPLTPSSSVNQLPKANNKLGMPLTRHQVVLNQLVWLNNKPNAMRMNNAACND